MDDALPFDLAKFATAIDEQRVELGLTWVDLSRQVGVSVSTIRRFASAADAEADGVLALIGWLGVAPENFVMHSAVAGVVLPASDGGMIRVDMSLLGRQGTRTTIQRLVAAAQELQRPVASLTRWSAI